jgi:ABC-2 type transport system permease protein
MKFLRDTWLVFQRAFGQSIRTPTWLVVMLFQPLLFLYLFGPLLKNSLRGVDTSEVFNLYIPGLMVQLALYGTLFACFTLTTEMRFGVIERFRVTPMSRFAMLLGRSLRDTVALVVQEALLIVLAIPLGLHVRLAGAIVALGIMALLGLSIAPLSYGLAMVLRRDEVLGPLINALAMPLLLLSGILIPMSFAPAWLWDLSRFNPLTHLVDAARQLFSGHLWNSTVVLGVLLSAALAAVMLAVVGRIFHRAAA